MIWGLVASSRGAVVVVDDVDDVDDSIYDGGGGKGGRLLVVVTIGCSDDAIPKLNADDNDVNAAGLLS
jgi:hypothetical protein